MSTHRVSIIIILLILPFAAMAQYGETTRISAGLALGKYGKFDHHYSFSDETNSPSFIIQAQRHWFDQFSLGAYIGYSGQKHRFFQSRSGEIKNNYYRLGALLSYDLNDWIGITDTSWDIYSTLKTGFSLEHRKWEETTFDNAQQPHRLNDSDSNLLFDLGVCLGARYHLNRDLALFSELGWGNAGFITFGASFNL